MNSPTHKKHEHYRASHGPPRRAVLPSTVLKALHSDQGQPYSVRGRAARLHAREDGLHVSFARCGSGRLSLTAFAEGCRAGTIRPVSEEAYAEWMMRLAGRGGEECA